MKKAYRMVLNDSEHTRLYEYPDKDGFTQIYLCKEAISQVKRKINNAIQKQRKLFIKEENKNGWND